VPGVDISFTVFFIILCVRVCTVTDFFAEDKASGVKFCSAVHRRPRQGITHFGELFPLEAQNWTNRPARVFGGQRVMVVNVVVDRHVWI